MDSELRLDIRLYLTFLQNTITRMGDYGKTCKQFSITILTSWFVFIGVLVSKCELSDSLTLSWIFIPIMSLWLLDTFFLTTEQQYRNKYNDYAQQYRDSLHSVDNASELINNLYCMNPKYNNTTICWYSVFFSTTFFIIYGFQIFLCGLVVGMLA